MAMEPMLAPPDRAQGQGQEERGGDQQQVQHGSQTTTGGSEREGLHALLAFPPVETGAGISPPDSVWFLGNRF
jgi:hypothetical protein